MGDSKHRAKAKPVVTMAILAVLLAATYFGAYYANLERFELLIVQRKPAFLGSMARVQQPASACRTDASFE